MGHIRLARWADAVVIAPATADLIAKIANGISDHLLTTLLQVREGPVLVTIGTSGGELTGPEGKPLHQGET